MGSPIKRLLSTAKTSLCMKNGFQAAVAVTGIVTIPVIFLISMSAFAAPVTHQDQGGKIWGHNTDFGKIMVASQL